MTVSSSSSTSSSGAAVIRARASAWSVVPMIQCRPRDDEHDPTGDPKREPAARLEAVAPDHDVGAAARDDAGGAGQRGESRVRVRGPDAGRIDDAGRADLELVPGREIPGVAPIALPLEERRLGTDASRCGGPVLHRGAGTASARRASSSTPS